MRLCCSTPACNKMALACAACGKLRGDRMGHRKLSSHGAQLHWKAFSTSMNIRWLRLCAWHVHVMFLQASHRCMGLQPRAPRVLLAILLLPKQTLGRC